MHYNEMARKVGTAHSGIKKIRKRLRELVAMRFGGMIINSAKNAAHDPMVAYQEGLETNLNNFVDNGTWPIAAIFGNKPGGFTDGLVVVVRNGTLITHVAIPSSGVGAFAHRFSTDGGVNWNAWDPYCKLSDLTTWKTSVNKADGTLTAGNSVISVPFDIDCDLAHNHTLIVDGTYQMKSFPCDAAGVQVYSGKTRYINAGGTFPVDFEYRVVNR